MSSAGKVTRATVKTRPHPAGRWLPGVLLVAGDAVHIHTPGGGQGISTGITDAHNLAWELALVAAGRAPGQRPHHHVR